VLIIVIFYEINKNTHHVPSAEQKNPMTGLMFAVASLNLFEWRVLI